jgi:hypothetical protein
LNNIDVFQSLLSASFLYCDFNYELVSLLDWLDVVFSINLYLGVQSMTQFPEVAVPCVFGGKHIEPLPRSGEYVAIHPHFNNKIVICGSSYLAGGVVTVLFFLKKMKLLGESMHLEVRETKLVIPFRQSPPLFTYAPGNPQKC